MLCILNQVCFHFIYYFRSWTTSSFQNVVAINITLFKPLDTVLFIFILINIFIIKSFNFSVKRHYVFVMFIIRSLYHSVKTYWLSVYNFFPPFKWKTLCISFGFFFIIIRSSNLLSEKPFLFLMFYEFCSTLFSRDIFFIKRGIETIFFFM